MNAWLAGDTCPMTKQKRPNAIVSMVRKWPAMPQSSEKWGHVFTHSRTDSMAVPLMIFLRTHTRRTKEADRSRRHKARKRMGRGKGSGLHSHGHGKGRRGRGKGSETGTAASPWGNGGSLSRGSW